MSDLYEVIHPKKSDAWMPFVPAIKLKPGTSLMFISGCTCTPLYHKHPHDPAEIAPPDDIAEQARRVFQNIKLSLDAVGAKPQDIVKITRYFTDIREQDVVNQVMKDFFGEHLPTSTTVQVGSLVFPGLRLEIECVVAVKD